MLSVEDFLQRYREHLGIDVIAGEEGMNRPIKIPEIERPGLALSGYMKGYNDKRILVFGRVEMEYLKDLSSEEREERLRMIFTKKLPLVIVARKYKLPRELQAICEEENIPLCRSHLSTTVMLSKLTVVLSEEFSPTISCHGTLVEAFGVGVLIQGDSSVGKSETALGLIERGHRLISDDVVIVKKRERAYLEGTGPELTRHLLEIRGIGIINVAHLYGAVCISEAKRIDVIVKLEEWDDAHFYDRIGLEDRFCDILGIQVPFYIMPVKPGRDVVLLLETIVLNHRLKQTGYNSAKEFNVKLLETISRKQEEKQKN